MTLLLLLRGSSEARGRAGPVLFVGTMRSLRYPPKCDDQ